MKPRPIAIHAADSIAARLVDSTLGVAVQHEQVEQQQRDDQREQHRPVPPLDIDVDEVAGPARREQSGGQRRHRARGYRWADGHLLCEHLPVIDIGRVGLWISLLDQYPTSRVREVVVELESLGWPCIWRPEASGRDAIVSAAHMLDATTTLRVATGVAQIQARHPMTAKAAQLTLHEASGGRFLLGLGVSHAPMITAARKMAYATPYSDMAAYLAAMQEAPFSAYTGDGRAAEHRARCARSEDVAPRG